MSKLISDKIRDYFYGHCNESDAARTREWLAAHSDIEEVDEVLLELLGEVGVEDHVMAREAFEHFCRRIGRPAPIHTPAKPARIPVRGRLARVVKWGRHVAAILAIPLALGLSLIYFQTRNATEWQEKVVPAGERGELLLSDGTLLRLNSGTRVIYPATFSGRQRKIFVNGEVYADVARDGKHPFVISAGDINVEVLGTEFNMRAYDVDSSVELALIEGSVRFGVDSEEFDREVVMLRNDLVKYDRRTGELELGTFQGTGYKPRAVGGGFYFFNESLTDIVARLSRDFDRKVVISDLQLAGMNFYAFFTNGESLLDILHTLNADGSMLIEEHREAIYITPRKKQ